MKVENIQCEFFINSIADYLKHKSVLLDLISKTPSEQYEEISNTDWTISKDQKREYLDYNTT